MPRCRRCACVDQLLGRQLPSSVESNDTRNGTEADSIVSAPTIPTFRLPSSETCVGITHRVCILRAPCVRPCVYVREPSALRVVVDVLFALTLRREEKIAPAHAPPGPTRVFCWSDGVTSGPRRCVRWVQCARNDDDMARTIVTARSKAQGVYICVCVCVRIKASTLSLRSSITRMPHGHTSICFRRDQGR